MAFGCPCNARSTGEEASCPRASPLAAAVSTEAEAAVGAVAPVPPTAASAAVVEEGGGGLVGGCCWEEAEAAISSKLFG